MSYNYFLFCLKYFIFNYSLLFILEDYFMSKRNSGQMINHGAYQHTKMSAGLQAHSVPLVPLSSSYPDPTLKVSTSWASFPCKTPSFQSCTLLVLLLFNFFLMVLLALGPFSWPSLLCSLLFLSLSILS